jgi:serine/threonine protein kinase
MEAACPLTDPRRAPARAQRDRFAKYSESFQREAEVLAKLNHPNIIRMYGLVTERDVPGSGGPPSAANGGVGGAPGGAPGGGSARPAAAANGGGGAGGGGPSHHGGQAGHHGAGGGGAGGPGQAVIIAGIMTEYVRGGPLSNQLRWVGRAGAGGRRGSRGGVGARCRVLGLGGRGRGRGS